MEGSAGPARRSRRAAGRHPSPEARGRVDRLPERRAPPRERVYARRRLRSSLSLPQPFPRKLLPLAQPIKTCRTKILEVFVVLYLN